MRGVYGLLLIPALFSALSPSELVASVNAVQQVSSAGSPPPSAPVRVAVYDDKGSPRTPRDMQRVLGGDPAHFTVRYLTAKEIESGDLTKFEVLIQGGGDSLVQSRELKDKGRDAIRAFVHNGGGYVGICGGAHFTVPGDKLKLGILNARVVDSEHWARGRGNVVLNFTEEGQSELKQPSRKTTLMYHQGPLLEPGDRTDLPPYTLLATYETEVAKNGAPHGVMQGTGAIVSAPYGNGRVIVFSPHPEQTNGQEGMVREAVFWAAGRAQKISLSPSSSPAPNPASSDTLSVVLPTKSEVKPDSQTAPAPSQSSAVESGCCGPITPAGAQLVQYVDSLNVEHLWPQHVFVDWRSGEPIPRNGRREPPTHCAAFAAGAADRLGIHLLHPPEHSQEELAAAQERWMGSDDGRNEGWRPVGSSKEAQTLANQGWFVVLVFGRRHGSGHIAIVRPYVKSDKALADEGPQTTQAGGHNFSSGTAKYSFVFYPDAWPNKVEMFAHPTKFQSAVRASAQ